MKLRTILRRPVVAATGIVLLASCTEVDAPRTVESRLGSENATFSSTAVGPDGTVYWAWFDRADDQPNVYLASLAAETTDLGDAVRVNRLAGDANPHGQAPAQVVVGRDGEVYVAWTNRIDVPGRRFPASDLLFARSNDGGQSFSDAVIVNDDVGGPPTGHTFHDVAVDRNGVVYVSWIDTRALDAAQAASGAASHGDAHEEHGHEHGHQSKPDASIPGPEVRVAKSIDGGRSFSRSVVVDRSTCPCCRTSLAVGADGSVYVAWRKVYEGDIRDMAFAVSTDGAETFSEARRIHADEWVFNGCPHSGPDIEVDPNGGLHAAWYTGSESGSGIFYRFIDGEEMLDPVALATDVPISQVRLAPAENGGVWIAWEDKREGVVKLAHAANGIVSDVHRTFAGEQPALAAMSGVTAVAWAAETGLSAVTVR